ncbi:MAG: phosphocholine cytidylyltransferase family protein [Firmicutes bacterium]|nr:phosphocholine cytidylyltransferase family protein [Bacillota bacterium]
MKAIILAAGRGTRISRMIRQVPKCTLPVGGKPLIRHTVELLISRGIKPIVCVGYKRALVEEALVGLGVKTYCNPFFDITNSIASLWFAREELDDDLLIMNGDVFFSPHILDLILADPRDVVMAIDKSRTITGDFFFTLTGNGSIRKYGTDLPLQERNCEYVGIAKISRTFLPRFRTRLDELVMKQKHELWWENVLYSFADNNERDILTKDVGGLFWSEIDYFDDYERILTYLERESAATRDTITRFDGDF